MYLEAGKCVSCNKKLDDTYQTASHNEYFHTDPQPPKYTPYFCSMRCVEKALDELLIDDWGKPPTEELKYIQDLYTARIQAADSDAAVDRFMAEARQKIAEARSHKKQADSEILSRAYQNIVIIYNQHCERRDQEAAKPPSIFDTPGRDYLGDPYKMTISADNILNALPPTSSYLRLFIRNFIEDISRVTRGSDFYSTDAESLLKDFFKLLIKHLGAAALWQASDESPSLGTTPLISVCADPIDLIKKTYAIFDKPSSPKGPSILRYNIGMDKPWSNIDLTDDPQRIVAAVFKGSPLAHFLTSPIALCIPQRLRFQHTHILAPSGFGKTTLLQQIILKDLKANNPPAYVVIDPKGLLVERISRLALFDGRLADRIVIVDPTHAQLPALSMFSMPSFADPVARARVLNHLIETFAYIFSSADARLTQRQGVPFSYVVRLVFGMNGDLNTLMDLLESRPGDPAFAPHIQILSQQDDGARRFFANEFHTKTFGETRQQIKTRLYEIISKPELMQMFAAKENKLSLFDCIQNRKIVLVNTAMGQLGTKASSLLGRYFISMTLNAAFSRFAVPKEQWSPAYLVIDEFQDFADEYKTPELLRLAREYNLGVVLAHQTMHSRELNEPLRTSISTNTNIKYSSNPEGVDLNYMARDLRCSPEFLKRNATPTDTEARFACFARGMGLEHPFIVSVPFGNIQAEPQMTETAYVKLLENNRKCLSVDKKPQTEPVPEGVPAQSTSALPQEPAPNPVSIDTSSEAGKDW